MKLVLDQGLPRSAVDPLRAVGIDAVHVGDLGMATATDDAILAWARASDSVVVTLDADFHASLARSGAGSPSVIRVRVEGLRGPQLAIVVQGAILACAADLAAGAVVSTDGLHARVRRLPLR